MLSRQGQQSSAALPRGRAVLTWCLLVCLAVGDPFNWLPLTRFALAASAPSPEEIETNDVGNSAVASCQGRPARKRAASLPLKHLLTFGDRFCLLGTPPALPGVPDCRAPLPVEAHVPLRC